MKLEKIRNLFEEFIKNYDEKTKTDIWQRNSKAFWDFWKSRILNESVTELREQEIDQIIRILDIHAKGRTKDDEAVARTMIRQNLWHRMFKEIKDNNKLHDLLNKIFLENEDNQRAILIDELYRINEGKKNGLTGKGGIAINAILGAAHPTNYVHAVSLNHREDIIQYFGFDGGPNFETDTPGKTIVLSNRAIINGFKGLGINNAPRTVSVFLYETLMEFWKRGKKKGREEADPNITNNVLMLLDNKKQIIIYGPPGTGKTFNTKKISLQILGTL
jgi:Cdc6-like AAA superfamily ATPase